MGDRRSLSYHLLSIDLLLQNLCLLDQGGLVSCILDRDQNTVQVERLLNKIEGSLLDAFDRSSDVCMAGNHYYRRFNPVGDQFRKHLDTVHPGHLDVAENGIVLFLLRHFASGSPVFSGLNFISFHLENLFERIPDGPFVVNYQYFHNCKYRIFFLLFP